MHIQENSGDQRGFTPYARLRQSTDEQLMQELQAGNADAFAVLFTRHHRLVQLIALNILRDASEAEDIVQDVFLEIYQKVEQFDAARGTVKAWLLQYAYSRSINRRNYLLVRQVPNRTTQDAIVALEEPWASTQLPTQEMTHLASEALSALPDAQRATLRMFFFEGLTFQEIAQRRSETFSNVRHHYYRGLYHLRTFFDRESCGEVRGNL